MRKKSMIVFGLLAMAIPAMANVYNYGTLYSLTDGSWGSEPQWSGDFASAIFSPTLQDHQIQFTQVLGYGENIANRGAYVWSAPVGESITSVQFYWWRSGDQADFKAALFTLNPGDTVANAGIAWSTNANNVMYADGTQTVAFPVAQNVKSIGIGLVDVWSAYGCSVIFNTISIETQAAPMHVVSGTVSPGGLSGDLSDIGVKVEFAQNGAVVKTAQVFLNTNGSYTIPEVVEGTYDVTVKGGFWFKKTFSGVTVLGDATLPAITLVAGDLNADAKVDVSDLGILAANYGTGTGAAMDFNKDAGALGLAVGDAVEKSETVPSTQSCGAAGVSLIAGVMLMGLVAVKLEE